MRKNMFLSTITLILTCSLLLCTICAWYVTNQEATASGITGSVANKEGIESINYYKVINAKNNDDYISFNLLFENEELVSYDEISMPAYDSASPNQGQILMEIIFDKAVSSSDLVIEAKTSTTKYIGKSSGGYTITSKNDNSLANIISFYSGSIEIDEDNSSALYSLDNLSSFVDASSDSIDSNIIIYNEANSVILNKIYILFDYYNTALEDIYAVNVGNSILAENGNIEFECDFEIIIRGL